MRSIGLFLAFFILIVSSSLGQIIPIAEVEANIAGISRTGQQATIQLDTKVVEKAWEKYLKERAGKVSVNKGVLTVELAQMDTISKNPFRILSKVEGTQEGTLVWWSLDLGQSYMTKDGTPEAYHGAEVMLRNFAKKLYKDDIGKQISDAEKVLQSTQAEYTRVVKSADDIRKAIEKNKARKIELENELQKNADELVQLTKDVDKNLKMQDAAKLEVENMKRSVEVIREKLVSMD